MALRIAFDLDGVLADMEGELARRAEVLFGEPMVRKLQARAADEGRPHRDAADPPGPRPVTRPVEGATAPALQTLSMTGRQERRLWQDVKTVENFWQTLDDLEPGVIARLSALAAEHRWEIIFLTARPETVGATAQMQTQRWLESKGFALPCVYVVQGSRGRIAAALDLDIVVDDRPENCLDVVADSSARAILVWREDRQQPPAATRRLGIGVVKSVALCLDILAHVNESVEAQPGMLERVKRMFGVNATTGG